MPRLLRTVAGFTLLASLLAVSDATAASVYATRTGTNPGFVYQLGVGAGGDLSLRTPESVSTTGYYSHGVGITPDGRYLYAANDESELLSQFAIGPTGLLSPLSPATVAVAKGNGPIAISPDGTSLYTAHSYTAIEQFTIGADGKLTPKSPPTVASAGTYDLVLSPDGKYLYGSNFAGSGLIYQYEVQADGTLKALTPPTVAAGSFPVGMAVTPDGHALYAGTESAEGIRQFTIGANGALSPMTPPSATVPAETNTEHLAVSPDGTHLYATDEFEGGLVQMAIGAGDALSLLSPPKAAPGTKTTSAAISPDGADLYVGRYTGEELQRFAIGADGALAATSNELPAVGVPGDIVVSPDQGPTAALAVTPALAGAASAFDAGGSSDPDGQVVRYDWSFGDGASATTAVPQTDHVYASAGEYTATVTVTDDEGASTARVFTGHQVLLDGGPAARASSSFRVDAPPSPPASSPPPAARPPVLSHLRIKPRRFAVGSPSAKHRRKGPRRGAYVSFRLSVRATIGERIQRRASGHRHHGKCSVVAKRGKRCRTWKAVKGSAAFAAAQGADRRPFSGRFNGRRLKPGLYRLLLTPRHQGVKGATSYAGFRIVRR